MSPGSNKHQGESFARGGANNASRMRGSAVGAPPGGTLSQAQMSPNMAGAIGNFPSSMASQQNNFSASLQHMLSESMGQNTPSAPAAQATAGGVPLGSAGGYPYLGFQSLQMTQPNLHTAGLNSADSAQTRFQQQSMVPPSAANNIYSMLLSQSLSGGSMTLPSAQYGAGTNNTPPASQQQSEDQHQQGASSGLFQQALQNEQLRAMLLSDDRYRHIIESLNRRPPGT